MEKEKDELQQEISEAENISGGSSVPVTQTEDTSDSVKWSVWPPL